MDDPTQNPCSPPLRILGKRGERITNLDEWRRYAGPAGGDRQWVEGRSALESARAWVGRRGPAAPEEIEDLLDSHPDTRGCKFGLVKPEVRVPLDALRGNTRNTDVLACGKGSGIPLVASIEAKVSESFGPELGRAITPTNPHSQVPVRIQQLCWLIFGRSYESLVDDSREFPELRYQLLHGLAASALVAQRMGIRVAAFIVHELSTGPPDLRALYRNHQDWDAFLRAIEVHDLEPGRLDAIGKKIGGVRCLVGKVVSERT